MNLSSALSVGRTSKLQNNSNKQILSKKKIFSIYYNNIKLTVFLNWKGFAKFALFCFTWSLICHHHLGEIVKSFSYSRQSKLLKLGGIHNKKTKCKKITEQKITKKNEQWQHKQEQINWLLVQHERLYII